MSAKSIGEGYRVAAQEFVLPPEARTILRSAGSFTDELARICDTALPLLEGHAEAIERAQPGSADLIQTMKRWYCGICVEIPKLIEEELEHAHLPTSLSEDADERAAGAQLKVAEAEALSYEQLAERLDEFIRTGCNARYSAVVGRAARILRQYQDGT
jgi:D-ribose pyranose/furanose isomerase RbsD